MQQSVKSVINSNCRPVFLKTYIYSITACLIVWGLSAVLSTRPLILNEASALEIDQPQISNLPIPSLESELPQEVRDLVYIVHALHKYRMEHQSYPISSRQGSGWDGFKSIYGESASNWIKGLEPGYIEKLPRDPRLYDDGMHGYFYISNGAKYKLIVHLAEENNLKYVKKYFPNLIDPVRPTYSYGFWTRNAVVY